MLNLENLKINPSLPLELLNGGAGIPEAIFLVLLGWYLVRETRRRRLGLPQLMRLQMPPSMNFAVAVFVFDAGVMIRSWAIWYWRFEGGGPFSGYQVLALMIGGALILVGGVCKVRSISLPDYGHAPWILTAAAIAVFLALSIAIR